MLFSFSLFLFKKEIFIVLDFNILQNQKLFFLDKFKRSLRLIRVTKTDLLKEQGLKWRLRINF